MNPLIQKTLDEFDENFTGLEPLFLRGRTGDNTRERMGATEMRIISREMKEWLTTALQEALIAGLEMAEGVVMESIHDCRHDCTCEGRGGIENASLGETLSRIAALKKEVMDV